VKTTRFPNGITTAKKNDLLGEFILPDPTTAHVYFEDFDYYNADDWTVTENGVATQALTDGDGGRLLISNDASDLSDSSSQKVGESFLFEAGKKLWFDCILQVNEAIESNFIIGLMITDTTPLTATDTVHFRKFDGSTALRFHVEKDGTSTQVISTSTIADATDIRLSFFYDGADKVQFFVDGVKIQTLSTDNLPDDEVLTVVYYIQNGEAASKTMNIDYVFVAKER